MELAVRLRRKDVEEHLATSEELLAWEVGKTWMIQSFLNPSYSDPSDDFGATILIRTDLSETNPLVPLGTRWCRAMTRIPRAPTIAMMMMI